MHSAVLLLFLGLGLAQACCPPAQWETTAFDMNSLDSHAYSMRIAHDDSTRMEGVNVYVIALGHDQVFRRYVKDYSTMVQYEIDPTNLHCTTTRLQETFISNADCKRRSSIGITNIEHYGNVTIGLPPSTIDMVSMSWEMDGKKVYAGLGTNGCFPIYEKIKTINGQGLNMMLFYYNTTTSGFTPGIFSIPGYCSSSPPS